MWVKEEAEEGQHEYEYPVSPPAARKMLRHKPGYSCPIEPGAFFIPQLAMYTEEGGTPISCLEYEYEYHGRRDMIRLALETLDSNVWTCFWPLFGGNQAKPETSMSGKTSGVSSSRRTGLIHFHC